MAKWKLSYKIATIIIKNICVSAWGIFFIAKEAAATVKILDITIKKS